MALPSNTLATFEAKGNREDLSNIIYRIDPTDTPFFSGCEKEKATGTFHEWQTQALAAASTANAQLEGDDSTTKAVTARVRLGNYTQISTKTVRVSGTQQAVQTAGVPNELANQEMLAGLELRRDVEAQTVGSNQARNAGADATARVSASVLSWIKTNTSTGGTSPSDPSAADGTATRTDGTGTLATFTEQRLKTVLSAIWVQGGKPGIVMTGAFNKQQFSTFTGRASPIEDTKAKTITASVSAYESDFGKLKVVANRFQRVRDVLIFEMDKWKIAHLNGRSMISMALAKTGDSERRSMLTEYTLVAGNEKASGGVFDNTSS
jgi:uncharacterized protein DUF5309